MKRRGYTLVEVLCVMTIIVVLTGILAPVFRGVRRSSQVSAAEGHLRQLWLAAELYRQNYDQAESGTGPQMGYPVPDVPLEAVWPKPLWRSPCGTHPDYVDGQPVLFTYQFTPYNPTWPVYFGELHSNAALIRDIQCDDFGHLIANPYVTHLGLAARADGSLWRKRAKDNPLSLRFWGLETKERYYYE